MNAKTVAGIVQYVAHSPKLSGLSYREFGLEISLQFPQATPREKARAVHILCCALRDMIAQDAHEARAMTLTVAGQEVARQQFSERSENISCLAVRSAPLRHPVRDERQLCLPEG
jgi:hypothetical protein